MKSFQAFEITQLGTLTGGTEEIVFVVEDLQIA